MLFVGDSVKIGLDVSFEMQGCGGMREKSGEVIMRVYAITNDEMLEFATGITLVKKLMFITDTFYLFQYGLSPDIQGTMMLVPLPPRLCEGLHWAV